MRQRPWLSWAWLAGIICLATLPACSTTREHPAPPPAPRVSFAVLADPRGEGETWKNALLTIRQRNATASPERTPAELIIVAGDMDPLAARYADYLQVFTNAATRPPFLPVIGNHEFEDGGVHFKYAQDTIIPAIPGAVRRHPASCDYHVDRGNLRIIVVDAYTDLGKDGGVNDAGRNWVEQVINDAPASIEHIFIALHEPAFPRVRHIGDSFDENPALRNAFWQMLVRHQERVRAVLVGHTHSYYRMRVRDPAGQPANDPQAFPDEAGGIYQIDAGAAGNGPICTVVLVQTEGRVVSFSVLQANKGADQPFAEVDAWRIAPPPGTP